MVRKKAKRMIAEMWYLIHFKGFYINIVNIKRIHGRKERETKYIFHARQRGCLNLRCEEQSRERTAIDPRQSWNPRTGHKIRIVGPSRLIKHSTSCGAIPERWPIPVRSSVKIACSITKRTNQAEMTQREARAKTRRPFAMFTDPKGQGHRISMLAVLRRLIWSKI